MFLTKLKFVNFMSDFDSEKRFRFTRISTIDRMKHFEKMSFYFTVN